jgi:16S rRNA (cytosine1402-N4)-methyltransferase
MSDFEYHVPVLLKSSIDSLIGDKSGVYVDVTFGGGSHSKEILSRLSDKGRLLGFDQDNDAESNILEDKRFTFVKSNFSNLKNFVRVHGHKEVDGILADLGVSSHQFDEGSRGFSFRYDAPLDMRMNQNEGITAAMLIQNSHIDKLQQVFSDYGEVRNAKTLAVALWEANKVKKIEYIADLLQVVDKCVFGERHKYLAQVFQALRIEVNEELEVLKKMLQQSLEILKPGGKLVVLSYHSLEDRLVKNFLKSGNFEGKLETDFYGVITRPFEILTKKAIEPDSTEMKQNSRSRSAKMRVASKL